MLKLTTHQTYRNILNGRGLIREPSTWRSLRCLKKLELVLCVGKLLFILTHLDVQIPSLHNYGFYNMHQPLIRQFFILEGFVKNFDFVPFVGISMVWSYQKLVLVLI